MRKQPQSQSGFIGHEDFLNVKNGVVDLRNGTFIPYQQEELPPIMADVEYDKEAKCPRWMRFLDEITCGYPGYQDYLQRMVGCCMTGQASKPCVFIVHGEIACGKSTFLRVIGDILGSYAKHCSPEILGGVGGSSNPRPEIVRLTGSRLLMVQDLSDGCILDELAIKHLTSDEVMSVRGRYQNESITFRPNFKIIVASNHLPVINGVSNVIWERTRVIPFKGLPSKVSRTKNLSEKLLHEKEGIFLWALAGAVSWYRDGILSDCDINACSLHYFLDAAAPLIGDKLMRELKANDKRLREIIDVELVPMLTCPNDMGFAEIDCPDAGCYACLLQWLRQGENGG